MDIYINGEINEDAVKSVAEQLKNYKKGDEIVLKIDSLGGFIDEAVLIAEMLVEVRNNGDKIKSLNTGDVMSAATIVWLCGDERIFDMEKGEFVIHYPFIDGGALTVDMLLENAVYLMDTQETLINFYKMYSSKTYEEVSEMLEQNRPMTWKELLEFGMATSVEVDELPDILDKKSDIRI